MILMNETETPAQAPAPAPAPASAPAPSSLPLSAAPPSIPPGQMEVMLQCPPDKAPGQTIQVRHPHSSQVFQVVIPSGARPGATFKALMPIASQPSQQQQQPQQQQTPSHQLPSHQHQQAVEISSIPIQSEKTVVLKSIETLNSGSDIDHDLLRTIMQLLNGRGKLQVQYANTQGSGATDSPGNTNQSMQQEAAQALNEWWGGGIGGKGGGKGRGRGGGKGRRKQEKGRGGKGVQHGPAPPTTSNPITNLAGAGVGVTAIGSMEGGRPDFSQDFGVQTPNSQVCGRQARMCFILVGGRGFG